MKTLVVFYSRTGTTKKVAEMVASKLACDIEEITDLKNRGGPLGWLSAGRDAGNKSLTKIGKLIKNPKNYDLTVIGSPVWNGTVSAPIRTYILENGESLGRIALFLTGYSPDNRQVINEVAGLLKEKMLASLDLNNKLVLTDKYYEKLEEFLRSLNDLSIKDGK